MPLESATSRGSSLRGWGQKQLWTDCSGLVLRLWCPVTCTGWGSCAIPPAIRTRQSSGGGWPGLALQDWDGSRVLAHMCRPVLPAGLPWQQRWSMVFSAVFKGAQLADLRSRDGRLKGYPSSMLLRLLKSETFFQWTVTVLTQKKF